ncbi:hypothetical protein K9O30_15280 [Clostridium bowmanii]|uniref:hypothetical protein n=1 Tax=Clostridium bowmanii TaxID=132925 RepID=UPI001C0D7A81|nr:hypothetical protein [Clostridium bowmanii]MBU3190528.1 hypothetical protein [Clostridium bowmanii]MCA1075059.1 hypothetical protein [Clostridium bowmanii]
MSIRFIYGIFQVVVGVMVLIEAYFVARDKIKLSKVTMVLHCIIIAILLLGGALKYFSN